MAAEQRQLAEEQSRVAQLEAAEAARLAAEAKELERYRSEILRAAARVAGKPRGVRIDRDRFVFSSEVLFKVGSADLAPEG